jgi:Domain of unknown function (DUF4136)
MKKVCILSTLVLLIFANAALAQDVRYNFVQGTNFGAYKTYKWVAIKGAEEVDTMLDGQIKSAFNAQLVAKGLTPTEGTPDLFVGYQLAIKQEKQFNSYSSGAPGFYGRGWYGAGGMTTTTGSTSTILVGQIALDIYDAKAEKIIWRGLASKTVDQKAKPDKQQKNLAKAAAKLLKNYPPPVKS